jgi:hypothetical protein
LPQEADLFAPSVDEMIVLGVSPIIPHAALPERELVLCFHDCRGYSALYAADATRVKDAILNDVFVLTRRHRPPDFVPELFTDYPSLPYTAPPQG